MKALLTIANLLLLAAAAWAAAGLFYQAATVNLVQAPGGRLPDRIEAARDSRPAEPLSAYGAIVRRNLFNTAAAPEAPAPKERLDIEQLKETALDLRLWGTVIVGDRQSDYAVIEDKKLRKQQLYRVGDPVRNAVVKVILREKVVLNVDGRDEILAMEELAAHGGAGRRTAAAPELPERKVVVDRQSVSEAMNDIGGLMRQVRVRPYFEKGQPAGLSLTGIRPDSIFQKFGIRSGDVLRAVEGEPIRSVQDVIGLYQKISAKEEVTVQIKRRGRIQDIQFQIQE